MGKCTNFEALKMDTVYLVEGVDIGDVVAVDDELAEEWEIALT